MCVLAAQPGFVGNVLRAASHVHPRRAGDDHDQPQRSSSGAYVVLLEGRSVDGSGTVVGRADGGSRYDAARLDDLLLAAGTYTIEATTRSAEATGNYTVAVNWNPAHEPVGVVLVGGSSVELVYDVALDEMSVPPVGAFSVLVDGASRPVTAVSVLGRVVTLALASAVLATQDVTVSYVVPTTAGTDRLEATNGDAARGFSGEPVEVPPEPPTITAVESSADGLTGGLIVSWTPVVGISGYDLQWRRDGEQAWQSTRTDVRQQFTLGGLVRGAFYWVQVRAVKTGGASGGTIYATDWSAVGSAIAGDWTPQNLRVVIGDGLLAVTWDDVPAATGYEVEYWPTADVAERTAVVPVRTAGGWRADIAGVSNGEPYGVAVRSTRTVAADPELSPGIDETTTSAWVTRVATPGSYLGGSPVDVPDRRRAL